jgi:hypothetical protein
MSNFDGNMFESARDRREREMFAPIESLVRAAGGYVRPSDDLRPSTLEAARHSRSNRRWNYRISGLACAVLLLAVCNIPGRFTPTPGEGTVAEATVTEEYELRQQSAKSLGFGFNPAWAWYEAFLELRSKQSKLIND